MFAAGHADAIFPHDAEFAGACDLEILLDFVRFSCRQHMPLGFLKVARFRPIEKIAALSAEHRVRLLAEHSAKRLC